MTGKYNVQLLSRFTPVKTSLKAEQRKKFVLTIILLFLCVLCKECFLFTAFTNKKEKGGGAKNVICLCVCVCVCERAGLLQKSETLPCLNAIAARHDICRNLKL